MIVTDSYLGTKKDKKGQAIYECKCCSFITSHSGHWKRHLQTKKHNDSKMIVNGTKKSPKKDNSITAKKWICGCGKSYKYDSGYYRHKKTCTWKARSDSDSELSDEEENVIVKKKGDLMFGSEEKDKFMEMVMKTTMEVVSKTTTEIIKNIAPHMGTNTNSFNTNNNFNINLFLNEQCANALSIQDFAKKLTLTMQDLATLKDNEPKAIQGIIKNNLKSLTITERPMHNHDKTWYVKDRDEGWEDDGGEKIVKTIKTGVSQKSGPTFVDNNPDWMTNQKKGEAYAETMAVAMKEPSTRCQNKILKSIEKDCSIKN